MSDDKKDDVEGEKRVMIAYVRKARCPHCGAANSMGLTGHGATAEPRIWDAKCITCNGHAAVRYQAAGKTAIELVKIPKGKIT